MRRKALSILMCLMMLFLVIPNEKIKGDNPPDGPNEPNVWPSADFFWLTPFPDEGESIKFDASISEDPDGNITKYEWDFDADGTYENNSRIVYHSWDEAGNYTVRLRVTDDDNATAVKEKVVRVYKKLDLDFIMNVTRELSNIVNKTGCERGRCFGTEGEREAKNKTKDWMSTTIGLEDVTEEKINGTYDNCELHKKRIIQDWYLHIIAKNSNGDIVWEVNLTKDDEKYDDRCFPIMSCNNSTTIWRGKDIIVDQTPYLPGREPKGGENKIWLIDHAPLYSYLWVNWLRKDNRINKTKCFILMDRYNDTKFMTQLTNLTKPGFSITGEIGNKILYYLSLDNYTVEAEYYQYHTYEKVKSYNVYGDISANNNNSTVIVGTHYDSWWGQCAVDNAIGTAIMLGIAKYFKENNFTGDKLKRGLRFIAFAREEWPPYCRGSKYYAKIAHANEEYACMINIDMVAHKWGLKLFAYCKGTGEDMNKIRNALGLFGYCRLRRNIKSESDDKPFDCPTVSFIRSRLYLDSYPLYHRDEKNHTKGDVMENIDMNKLRKTSKLILETVKYYSLKNYIIPDVGSIPSRDIKDPRFAFYDAPLQENSTNFIPYEPSRPSPENGSQNVSVNITLSWLSGDFDADNVTYKISIKEGDALPCVFTVRATVIPVYKYDLLFHADGIVRILGINISNETAIIYRYEEYGHAIDYVEYKISLQYNTTYEWQVTACDEHGAIATSKTWKFTTIAG